MLDMAFSTPAAVFTFSLILHRATLMLQNARPSWAKGQGIFCFRHDYGLMPRRFSFRVWTP